MTDEGPDHASGLHAVAARYGVGLDAVRHLLRALEAGNGTMAQFDHPELGGMGQWSSGGMTMVGRMFDADLKARVAGLCAALVEALPTGAWAGASGATRGRAAAWWPAGLGTPASAGAQDGLRYAYFPEARRLVIESGAGLALYDTGAHAITGVSQANGALRFTGPQGGVALDGLARIEPDAAPPAAPEPALPPRDDAIAAIARLAELHGRGVLTEREFAAKKAELLSRI